MVDTGQWFETLGRYVFVDLIVFCLWFTFNVSKYITTTKAAQIYFMSSSNNVVT